MSDERKFEIGEKSAKESPGDAVLMAFWDGKSKGTKQMIKSAKEAGIQVYIFTEE